jgi:hypothetical protein
MSGRKRLLTFNNAHPCIFVLSTGRVGTVTLSELFNLSSNILSFHEPQPELYAMSKRAYLDGMTGCEGVWDDVFMSLRTELIESALADGVGYVETSPQCTFLATAIYRTIPNVKFIHMAGHPATVVRSGMRRGWYEGHPADATRIIPKEDSEIFKSWSDMGQLAKNAWLWSETNKWIFEFTSSLPEENYLYLKSEDIFSCNKNILNKLYRFCSSGFPREDKIKKILSHNYNKDVIGNFPPFEQWSSADVDLLKFHAGEMAEKMEYNLKSTP